MCNVCDYWTIETSKIKCLTHGKVVRYYLLLHFPLFQKTVVVYVASHRWDPPVDWNDICYCCLHEPIVDGKIHHCVCMTQESAAFPASWDAIARQVLTNMTNYSYPGQLEVGHCYHLPAEILSQTTALLL